MGARLGNTGGSDVVITFIDCVLHLLQELINVDQVALRPDIAHWRQMVCWCRSVWAVATAANCHSGRHGLILWNRSVDYGKLKTLETEETLADSGVRVEIELASLQVAKELVKCVIAALL